MRNEDNDIVLSCGKPQAVDEERKYLLYVYLDPQTEGVFLYEMLQVSFPRKPIYVGVGVKNRPSYHRWCCQRKDRHGYYRRFYRYLRACLDQDYFPEYVILEQKMTFQESRDREKVYIACIGREDLGLGPLLNGTDGGEGRTNICVSEATREKQRIGSTNHIISEQARRKLSIMHTGSGNPRYGIPNSEEQKNKIRRTAFSTKRKHILTILSTLVKEGVTVTETHYDEKRHLRTIPKFKNILKFISEDEYKEYTNQRVTA